MTPLPQKYFLTTALSHSCGTLLNGTLLNGTLRISRSAGPLSWDVQNLSWHFNPYFRSSLLSQSSTRISNPSFPWPAASTSIFVSPALLSNLATEMEQARLMKEAGNHAYRAGDFATATDKYTRGLSILESLTLPALRSQEGQKLRFDLMSNRLESTLKAGTDTMQLVYDFGKSNSGSDMLLSDDDMVAKAVEAFLRCARICHHHANLLEQREIVLAATFLDPNSQHVRKAAEVYNNDHFQSLIDEGCLTLYTPEQAAAQTLMKDCSICLDDDASVNVLRLGCGHVYHEPCIRAWFKRGVNTCPFCRVRVSVRDNIAEIQQMAQYARLTALGVA
ncbi:hypothetical protein CAC42_6706 [Sphaceloma murrayae]|uniref:RING-type domain-containing protein n=1 Tax=Sphaceloma murrayae TaxID=2082308 RepID=A0A2K1QH58_9PEZI|nr:hypothetical protein CAC42_6706 [Sphaceloma murrayae]